MSLKVFDPVDRVSVQKAVSAIIRAIGEDPHRAGMLGTPGRIAEMYAEVFAGLCQDPLEALRETFDEGHQEMVILKDIQFYSMCEHHFLPFYGVAHVGYIPKGKVVGISKLASVVDILAKRPQVQERLTSQIADTIEEGLRPAGVAVVLRAEHLCITMRGIKKPGSNVVTSATRGVFRSNAKTRAEFLSLVEGN